MEESPAQPSSSLPATSPLSSPSSSDSSSIATPRKRTRMEKAASSKATAALKGPERYASRNSKDSYASSNSDAAATRERSSIYREVTRSEAHLCDKNSFPSLQKERKAYLGTYDTKEEASRAYDLEALKDWGPEIILNFSEDESSTPVLAAKLKGGFESEPHENNSAKLATTGLAISNPAASMSNPKRRLGCDDAKTSNAAALIRAEREHVKTCSACWSVPPTPDFCVQLSDDFEDAPSNTSPISGDHTETNDEASINSNMSSHSPRGVPSNLTQVFVDIGGETMSLQEDMNKLTVKQLAEIVCGRTGDDKNDIYLTFSGDMLMPEQLLSHYHIRKDDTITVNYRARGGKPQTIEFKTWDDILDNQPTYQRVHLPRDLVDTIKKSASATFLSEYVQHHSRQVLIALCREHVRGVSFRGKFTYENILFNNGIAKFDDAILREKYDLPSAKLDYEQLHPIFEPAFLDGYNSPIHVVHLLDFLWELPAGADPRSEAVIAFLTNHPALICYMKRLSINDLLKILVRNLSEPDYRSFPYFIDYNEWMPLIMNVPTMKKVLHHHATYDRYGNVRVPYRENGAGCLEFSRNFTNHALSRLRELEAALSLAMESIQFLPEILLNIALRFNNKTQPCPKEVKDFIDSYIDLLGRNTIGIEDHM